MVLNLAHLKPSPHSTKKRQRIGRGGKRGSYSGRGSKGQRARSGGKGGLKRLGMRQLMERTHKLRGFKSIHPKPAIVSLDMLNKNFKDGEQVEPKILLKKKLVANIRNGVKILSNGKIQVKVTVAHCQLSKTAQAAIKQAGGKII